MLADELRQVERTARKALRAVRELEGQAGGDVFGQFVMGPEESDAEVESELLEFAKLARQSYPGCEIVLIAVANIE